jgi:HK97 family phage major capsid protein
LLSGNTSGPTPAERAADPKHLPGWNTAALVESEAFKHLSRVASSRKTHIGNIELGQAMSREDLVASLGQASGFTAADVGSDDVVGLIQPDRRGLVPPVYRPLRLLDLIPSGPTDSNLVEYTQVTKLPEEAAETSEGSRKPEASIGLEDADAPIRTIAEWIKVRKQTLADASALRTFLDTALRYDVQRRAEAEIIAGDGIGENLLGLLEQPNTLEPTVSGSYADRVHNGLTAITLADLEPNAVALNPLDWEAIRLSRDDSGASTGTGSYLFGPPSVAGASTLWGLTPVVSPVVPQGTALVLDTRGVVFLVREGVNVLVSDSDGEDFTHNRVTILAEMRGGIVVWRPESIAIVDLAGS